ncbi:MAG: FecR domain-containing protein [Polyangia bacterium]
MTPRADERSEGHLVRALRQREYQDPGPARLEFEKRRLLARLACEERRLARSWRGAIAGGLLGAGAVAAAVAAIFLLLDPSLPGAERAVRLSGTWHLSSGDAIARGTAVIVPEDERAVLLLPDGTGIRAAGGTRMSVQSADGSAIRVDRGRLLVRVVPRPRERRLRVLTPDAEVVVHGTIFSVEVGEPDGTAVRLFEGEVRLACRDRTVTMRPGHRVVVDEGGLVSMGALDPDERFAGEELQELARLVESDSDRLGARLIFAKESRKAENDEAPIPLASDAPAAGPEIEDRAGADSDGDGDEGASGTRRAVAHRRPTSLGERVEEHWSGGRYARVIDLTEEVKSDAELLYTRARALARLHHWREAAICFERVAALDSARKGEALYLSADAFRRTVDFDRSLELAERAIEAGGPNADHAWGVKLSALTGMGRYSAAAAAAGVYLDRFPSGAHVGDAHFVRGTGLRLERRWEEAVRAYEEFLSTERGSAAMNDDAEFYSAYGLLRFGRTQTGREALESYLVRHPQGRHADRARSALEH